MLKEVDPSISREIINKYNNPTFDMVGVDPYTSECTNSQGYLTTKCIFPKGKAFILALTILFLYWSFKKGIYNNFSKFECQNS